VDDLLDGIHRPNFATVKEEKNHMAKYGKAAGKSVKSALRREK
jgi:hypothetical protein